MISIRRSFNIICLDTYRLYKGNDASNIPSNDVNKVTVLETGIAWPSDINNKFKNSPTPAKQWQDMTNGM